LRRFRPMSSRAERGLYSGGGRTVTTQARVRRSQPTRVPANGVELCVQTFGEAVDPAILLVAGAASSMDWWEDELCERLAFGSRFVIRYDLRDTGQSVTTAGAPRYSGRTRRGRCRSPDVLRETAPVVGISMGGGSRSTSLDTPIGSRRYADLDEPGGPASRRCPTSSGSVRAAGRRAGLGRPASRRPLHRRRRGYAGSVTLTKELRRSRQDR
jgi:pimeloyl-ACP methyl ester carboxylesterase